VLTFIQGAMGPRLREEKPHAEMRGVFFACWFVVLEAKATSVWAPASAGVTSSGAILANVYKRAHSSVIVRLVIWVPQGALKKNPCRNAWGFFRLKVC
jgi:hypothetical protein